jgi:hypothetical protein
MQRAVLSDFHKFFKPGQRYRERHTDYDRRIHSGRPTRHDMATMYQGYTDQKTNKGPNTNRMAAHLIWQDC